MFLYVALLMLALLVPKLFWIIIIVIGLVWVFAPTPRPYYTRCYC